MVTDTLKHASLYYSLSPAIETALRYLVSTDLMSVEPGRYELEGGCYSIVQEYETAPREEKRWEAHRKYIDVQFIASGMELMGYADCSTLTSIEAYNNDGDIEWFGGDGSFLVARAGTFVILYPHDAHMPGVTMDKPARVRKVVVKVPVER